jgi:hypothetical protein
LGGVVGEGLGKGGILKLRCVEEEEEGGEREEGEG